MSRSPRGATHAVSFGGMLEVFYKRCGRVVFEFNNYRHEWNLTSLHTSELGRAHRLEGDELHPETRP